ncbi:MAG TPA: hypothetical protein VHD61_01745 [Lacunisphaera sp.]|nr:hypothetical protein [Lacunisphaera sp.]
MITSTPRTSAPAAAGFTLAEVIIASTLSAFVLAGVLSAFVFIGRSGFRTSGLSEMETEVRRGLEAFAEDARAAVDVHWNSAQSVTFTLPSGASSTQVTWAYDGGGTGDTAGCLYRVPGDGDSTAARRIVVRHVAPDFTFKRYKIEQDGVSDNTAANDLETKQLQLVLQARRTSVAAVGVTQSAVTARYVLRNKRVTN